MVLLTTLAPAYALDLCADIETLIDQSRVQFADIAEPADGNANDRAVTLMLPGASACSLAGTSNRSVYQCRWEFPHRAAQASETYDALVRGVDDCIGERAKLHTDQSVNHPDYYALRRYEMAPANVSVSIKDKSALDRTIVFVTVQGAN